MEPDPRYTFDRFLVGGRNELAANAARRAAESPGSVYNPLLIRGGSGVGKTHILHAIAHYVSAIDPDLTLRLETADSIAERVTSRIVSGDSTPLYAAFAGVDILLVDEIERISGMDRTQDELAAIASRMVDEGRQLVFASVLAPADLPGLTRALRSVLDRGTVIDIDPPDAETRGALALQAAGDRGAALPVDVARALSGFDFLDARVLRAAVARLLDLATHEGRECLPTDVYRVLPEESAIPSDIDEFDSFLSDITRTLTAVVETSPWRRRIGEAILRWEGEGVRTGRLDDALQADAPPDVEALLDAFARDATRLLEIRAELGAAAGDEPLDDPNDIERAEAMLNEYRRDTATVADPGSDGSAAAEAHPSDAAVDPPADPWFTNPAKVVLGWSDVDGRLIESPR